MTSLRNVDLSGIDDKDLTPEQRDELKRRFMLLFGPALQEKKKRLAQAKGSSKPKRAAKKVRKWAPGSK